MSKCLQLGPQITLELLQFCYQVLKSVFGDCDPFPAFNSSLLEHLADSIFPESTCALVVSCQGPDLAIPDLPTQGCIT